jgi:hypothetical protein
VKNGCAKIVESLDIWEKDVGIHGVDLIIMSFLTTAWLTTSS